jgi:hypothetical protein
MGIGGWCGGYPPRFSSSAARVVMIKDDYCILWLIIRWVIVKIDAEIVEKSMIVKPKDFSWKENTAPSRLPQESVVFGSYILL